MHPPRQFRHLTGPSLMASVMLALTEGCTHKDLLVDTGLIGTPLVAVRYEWNQYESQHPEGMANLFYLSDFPSDSYWRMDFRPDGGTVRIPPAVYDAVTFNNDTENVIFTHIDDLNYFTFSTSEIDTGDIPSDQLPFPPQRLFRQPDRMWSDFRDGIEIKQTSYTDTITFSPKRITRDYHIEMNEIENLQSALRYYAVISDLTSSYRPSLRSQVGEAVSMGGFMSPMDATTLSSTVISFGMSPKSSQSRLAVYMWLADGQRKVYHYDITDQILEAPDSMNLMIRVKGPSLPDIKPGEGGNSGDGLDVGVDNWDIIDIEL